MTNRLSGDETAKESDARVKMLDGLRGIAIVLVLFNHLLPNINYAPSRVFQWFSNLAQSGWAGVDLFFVISGYLITGILIRAKTRQRYFQTFYIRRTLRIFPLYYGSLLLVFGVYPLLPIVDWKSFGPVWWKQLWNWLYATNLAEWFAPEGLSSAHINLAHFWSLAVEEHFYLVWPVIVYLAPIRYAKWISISCIMLVLILRTCAVYVWDAPHAFFHQTFCRADALAFGALVAALQAENILKRYKKGFMGVGVIAFLVLVGLFLSWRCLAARDPIMHSVGYTLLALVSTGFVVLSTELKDQHWLGRLLGCRALRFFGHYSYGLYVIHGLIAPTLVLLLPVELFIGATQSVGWGGVVCALARIFPCVILSMLSWRFLENPFLRLKRHFEYNNQPIVSKVSTEPGDIKVSPYSM